MNHLITTADRNTHIRIVAVSLAVATVFVAAMVGSHLTGSAPGNANAQATAPIIVKAGPSTQFSGKEQPATVR